MTLVIYVKGHPEIRFADTGQVAKRLGEPIDRPDADALVERGDFMRFVPEPVEWTEVRPKRRAPRKKQ